MKLTIPKTLAKREDPWNIISLSEGDSMGVDDGAIVIRYTRGKHGQESGGYFKALPTDAFPATECTLSYDVYFPNDFQWCKGGKLPGIGLGTTPTDSATGGEWDKDSGSVRVMWRDDGEGGAIAVGYLYLAIPGGTDAAYKKQTLAYKNVTEQKGDTGHEVWGVKNGGDFVLKRGRWNTVVIRVKLNSPGKNDGVLEMTVNGKQRKVPVQYRADAAVKANHVLFVSFFGGSDDSWDSPINTYAKFKNVNLITN